MSLRPFDSLSRVVSLMLLGIFTVVLMSGCIPKPKSDQPKASDKVELVYYKLFDDEDVMQPLIAQYQTKHPNVTIRYRKFTDPKEYENLVVNELAEGKGPDLFSAPNYWFLRHYAKLSPLPANKLSAQQFDQTFVNVASKDLTLLDPTDGQRKVFGLPLTVDTLALYYNKSVFEDVLASRGRPAATWEELKDDVFKLSKKDNSFERFQLAGIAMGRSDNIARAVDILYMLMLQYKAKFYNDNVSQAIFAHQQVITPTALNVNPAAEALKLYVSFAQAINKNYSWNGYLANSDSPLKEMETFARGKVAMIFGYSYLYDQIKAEIKDLKDKGVSTMNTDDIRISVVPQVNNPALSLSKRDAFANYYAETVARTSKHPDIAWDFLLFLSSKDNLAIYNQKTHRPTSRRDMLEEQKRDPIYGVFAEQTGFADSLPIFDFDRYRDVFGKAIDSVLGATQPQEAVNTIEDGVNALLPQKGMMPTFDSKP